ncbi:peptidase M48-like protein [Bisgaardia hudsonensis]|uniref:Peptidase M48-like protein n=1 Tax=Bisgaardia hudsonensis TaxID=109472 RepID=A0A4R2N0K1_9PAST|nr:M48 family metallopeptidase [Bisgaardia hudsonensis]QLB13494.1 deoxyribonuclease HsdR [Bisgaardia hudsonensis]TCP12905.1 peptidase M48-like protein [Bisgaardia hudsonensis]
MQRILKQLSVISSIAILLTACAGTAEINQQAASSYAKTVNEVKTKGMVDNQSQTAKRIYSVFNKLRPYADQENQTGQKFDWQITVIKSKELNAWAMPGGKMAFYTGLVDNLKLNDNEIATVMGHEMAHALKEHGKKKVNLGMFTNVVAQVAQVTLATQIGSEASGLVVGLASDWGINKPYSRSNETEADEVGLFLMAKAGYNPAAAPGLWDKMAQKTGGSGGVLAALSSTHPNDKARKANLQRLLPEAIAIYKNKK